MDRSLLDVILAPGGITILFQPIFEVRGGSRQIHALECLARGPKGSNLEAADTLFEYVRRKREESLVDRACVALALRAAREIPVGLSLSFNVHASTLGRDHGFVAFLSGTAKAEGIDPLRLTIEIVEHSPPWDGSSFLNSLAALRDIGVRIALDDVGLGQSNYKMILDCRPDYFKIDRYFVQGAHGDVYRQAVIESVLQLARRFGGRVVAEGVEDSEDLVFLTEMGIDLFQGYLFSPALGIDALAERNIFDVPAGPPARTSRAGLTLLEERAD